MEDGTPQREAASAAEVDEIWGIWCDWSGIKARSKATMSCDALSRGVFERYLDSGHAMRCKSSSRPTHQTQEPPSTQSSSSTRIRGERTNSSQRSQVPPSPSRQTGVLESSMSPTASNWQVLQVPNNAAITNFEGRVTSNDIL